MGTLRIAEISKILHVHPNTLRNWEKQGKIIPKRTLGGHRRYDVNEVSRLLHFQYYGLFLVEADDNLSKKYYECLIKRHIKQTRRPLEYEVCWNHSTESFLKMIDKLETGVFKEVYLDDNFVLNKRQRLILEDVCRAQTIRLIPICLSKYEGNVGVGG